MYRRSDSFLLEKLKEGDKLAFDAFFIKYYKVLVANAYFHVKEEQEAKDIIQDFLCEFWQKKVYMRLKGDVKAYMFKAIQNRCLNIHKKKILEKQKQFSLPGNHLFELDDSPKHEEMQLVLMLEAINGLPQQRKEVLHRVYFEKKKYQEAADEMGISLNTVKTHLKIGLKYLREKLKGTSL